MCQICGSDGGGGRHFHWVGHGHSQVYNGGSSAPVSGELTHHTRDRIMGVVNLLILDLLFLIILLLLIVHSSSRCGKKVSGGKDRSGGRTFSG